MADQPLFLRSKVIVEPLIDRFFAWPYTMAPVQSAMNLAFLQVPLLESYLQSPQVHVAASNNPELRGGYFINIPEERADEVRDLLAAIKRDRAHILRFAEAVAAGQELLRANATGFDLTPLYPKLPPELGGLVELAYDTDNQAQMRFMEPLVYQSDVYQESRQSVQLSFETGIERPFVLSTPRLTSPDVIELDIPFRHAGLEELFKTRVRSSTLGHLREALGLDDAQASRLSGMLSEQPSLAEDRHIEGGGRIRYFGHACLVLQTPQAAVVTDPFISADSSAGGRYTLDDLPDFIDLVVITHGHQDHIVLETLLQLRGRVGAIVVPRSSRGNLADPSMALMLKNQGFPVIEVDDFDEVEFPGGKVTATPFLGEHCDLDIRAKSTYWVELAGKKVFVGADSSGIDPMLYRYIKRHLGTADYAFLGMECDGAPLTWLYQALLTIPITKKMSNSRKLSGSNAEQAGAIMTELEAKEAYVYAMGEEPWLGHVMATTYTEDTYQIKQIDEFLTWCKDRDIKAGHLYGQQEWRW
ncbi:MULTISPECIES: MBL fold metallo-hydrolase [unclassified Streptomyces]|uniref:MBL fold metallo-hydrolase n=1 Tax=unclassified Streptomyces TaxID=2593676 RepID=UPI0029620A56|nr:MBL fold metallo-hydrolase [Streptomyces sp. N50]WOX07950.1 MBL fold metallo-hydrolase [Streptomyces sp. N50]